MKKIQLLLPSGGARGLSFIGVLQVIEEMGIEVCHVVANSMGAILGAAWCSGVSAFELEARVLRWRRRHFICLQPLSPALFGNRALRKRVSELLRADYFEDLRVPLTVVATDYEKGEPVVFRSGLLMPPIVGSSLAAGVFHPMFHEGRWLIDGGYTAPMPIAYADEGNPVVAVDPSAPPDWTSPRLYRSSLLNLPKLGFLFPQILKGFDTLIWTHVQACIAVGKPLVIRPEMPGLSFIDFHRAREAIAAGRLAATELFDQPPHHDQAFSDKRPRTTLSARRTPFPKEGA